MHNSKYKYQKYCNKIQKGGNIFFTIITTGLADLKTSQNPHECLYHIYNNIIGKLAVNPSIKINIAHYDKNFDKDIERIIRQFEDNFSAEHNIEINSNFISEYYNIHDLRELVLMENYLFLDFAHMLLYKYDEGSQTVNVIQNIADQHPRKNKISIPGIKSIYIPIWDCGNIHKLFNNFEYFTYDAETGQVTTYIEKMAERMGLVVVDDINNPILPPDFFAVKNENLMALFTEINTQNNNDFSLFLWKGIKKEKKQIPTNWRDLWISCEKKCIECNNLTGSEGNFGLCSVCRKKYL
jgi:hypothetical protein